MDYELWVIDNYSPEENIKWMEKLEDINLIFIRTEPKIGGSYSNGLALEIAARFIAQKSKYAVTFHLDIAVCKYGWLQYLLSKLDNKVRAAGFRLTKERVPEGVLHVCGYLIDFQLYKRLNLSFMPELPSFDVGDKVIYEFMQNGFKIFSAPNTFDDSSLIELIPKTLAVYNLNVTRAFDDGKDVVYMHLGRGVLKSRGLYKNLEKATPDEWSEYIRRNLLSEPYLQTLGKHILNEINTDSFSIRNLYNIDFIKKNLRLADEKAKILYLGKKIEFDYNFKNNAIFINLDNESGFEEFDKLTRNNGLFDYIIYPEIIDFPGNLKDFFSISHQLLCRGGVLIITWPFMLHDNADEISGFEYDYKAVSDILWKTGFREVSVAKQGLSMSVKLFFELRQLEKKLKNLNSHKVLAIKDRFIKNKLKNILSIERKINYNEIEKSDDISTGYGVRAVK
jgi:hypothetical protein